MTRDFRIGSNPAQWFSRYRRPRGDGRRTRETLARQAFHQLRRAGVRRLEAHRRALFANLRAPHFLSGGSRTFGQESLAEVSRAPSSGGDQIPELLRPASTTGTATTTTTAIPTAPVAATVATAATGDPKARSVPPTSPAAATAAARRPPGTPPRRRTSDLRRLQPPASYVADSALRRRP